jgi:predicted dehydrogenase
MKKTRRSFIKKTAGAAAALAAFPAIVPASALGRNGQIVPSDRVVMGAIGMGSMGNGNTREFLALPDVQMVAVCDVDSSRLAEAQQKINVHYANNDCRAYEDYRELLDKEKIDAVMIPTPDHWHALLAVACANAGLDIYGEKPLARSIKEGRAIVNAVEQNNRIWQTGSWQRSRANFHRACELVINGRIGKVHYVEVGLPNGRSSIGTPPAMEAPKALNWDFWLGPAPTVPYRGISHWDWRWIMDYSGGQLTDWAGHHIDIAHWGLGLDTSGPISVEGQGVYPSEGIFDVPVEYDFMCEYADGLKMRVANASRQPNGMGTTWYGEHGWIYVSRGDRLSASDENILKEEIGDNEIKLYQSGNHRRNFIDCVRSREQTITPAEYAHRSISVGLLGEIAMLTGEKILWDPEREVVTNSEVANRLLVKPYRNPWNHDMIR